MSGKSRLRSVVDATLACLLIGCASFWGVQWLLGWVGKGGVYGEEELRQVAFDAAVLDEPDDYVADVRAAAAWARERWSYAEYRRERDGVDLDALEGEALALLGERPDAARFHRALLRFTAGLLDGHAGVVPTAEHPAPPRVPWPFSLIEVAEGLMVDGVVDGWDGAPRGALLFEVDGRPVEDWVAEAERLVCASTPGARRAAAIRFLFRTGALTDADVRFRFRLADGSEAEAGHPGSRTRPPEASVLPRTREHKLLDDRIGYFRPGDFSPPDDSGYADASPEQREQILAATFADFDAVLAGFAETDGLILDLRNNPGGTDLLGQFLTDRLLDDGYIYFRLSALGAQGWRRPHAYESSAPAGKAELRQPLVVLIDADTFSTADNVAACLADNHPDVTFVGRANGAGTGAPRPFALPRTGVQIYFCTQRVRRANGEISEGNPVRPDIPVQWTRADVLDGRDPDLAVALALFDRR